MPQLSKTTEIQRLKRLPSLYFWFMSISHVFKRIENRPLEDGFYLMSIY